MLAHIPAAIGSETEAPGGDYPHLREKSAMHVLVVDDEPLVRWSIAETLRARGCAILEAEDARGAIQAIGEATVEPDAVLLDLRLPDSDDLGLLASVRRLLPGVPVILMTAFGSPEIVDRARRLGAFTVLEKPFELDELARLLERAVQTPRPN